jgi:hypothetical protein
MKQTKKAYHMGVEASTWIASVSSIIPLAALTTTCELIEMRFRNAADWSGLNRELFQGCVSIE